MSRSRPKSWDEYARIYLATGDADSYMQALEHCGDERAVWLLSTAAAGFRGVNPREAILLFRQLRAEGQEMEAQTVGLFGLLGAVPQDLSMNGLSSDETQGLIVTLERGLDVCRDHAFLDCEAAFSYILGCYLGQLTRGNESRRMFQRSAELYRVLSDESPALFGRELEVVRGYLE
jgi:hypothetical protein